ncbi:MAG: class I SAM-dependent methyltransferase [Candidatus Saccharicenans sp.]
MKSGRKSSGQIKGQTQGLAPTRPKAASPVLSQLEKRKQVYASFGYDVERERRAIIEAALPLSGRILEAGTGKGHLAVSLAKLGYRLVSFDLSEEQLKAARENLESQGLSHLVELKRENGEQLSFPDASFDVVFSVNMVHHLERPLAVLSELIRVLRPGGKLVISDFSSEGLAMMAEVHRREGGEHQVAPMGLDQVEKFLVEKGFRVNRSASRFEITLVATKP